MNKAEHIVYYTIEEQIKLLGIALLKQDLGNLYGYLEYNKDTQKFTIAINSKRNKVDQKITMQLLERYFCLCREEIKDNDKDFKKYFEKEF